ncbi:GTP pyrophosphokinase family protein [Alkalibaculum bacchi]|uniref:GTP pyrophosphokinase n=1 Tax=Alkalibaculum bacchi TaxID=645887 RepID=UPI0026F20E74|nr:GTP pyrophosphokinase family protein [Alkalibaculum bacchi]
MEIKPIVAMEQLNIIEKDLKRFLLSYRFGLEEVMTKINILRQDFQYIHDYNPIEHVKSRVKSPESILKKINRKDLDISIASIKESIRDIAGIRIVCSFISDIYTISEMIQSQKDLKIVECKDYIKNPKPNGYQSLHLILQIPVFMSDGVEEVYVEIQIRTIGMDFWASLEHKIFYKYNKDIPQKLIDELREAAIITAQLEKRMEILNNEIERIKQINSTDNKNR